MKYWYFLELSYDKQNLKLIFISHGIYETSCVFYIPEPFHFRSYISSNLECEGILEFLQQQIIPWKLEKESTANQTMKTR